jgi:hypothetical protein
MKQKDKVMLWKMERFVFFLYLFGEQIFEHLVLKCDAAVQLERKAG